MQPHASHPVIGSTRLAGDLRKLAERVAAVGGHEAPGSGGVVATGWPAVDAALGGGLRRDAVHEWFGDCRLPISDCRLDDNATRVSGQSAIGNRQSAMSAALPLSVLVHLAHRAMDGDAARWVVWIGRRVWPYPHAMVGGGDDSNARLLLERSIWVDVEGADAGDAGDAGDIGDPGERLWSVDQAAGCAAVGVVIADASGFDMAATRRLQLRAQRGGALVLLGGGGGEMDRLSAAGTRWGVEPRPSPNDQPRWLVRLLRCKGTGAASIIGGGDAAWLVERDYAQGDLRLAGELVDRPGEAADGVATRRPRAAG